MGNSHAATNSHMEGVRGNSVLTCFTLPLVLLLLLLHSAAATSHT